MLKPVVNAARSAHLGEQSVLGGIAEGNVVEEVLEFSPTRVFCHLFPPEMRPLLLRRIAAREAARPLNTLQCPQHQMHPVAAKTENEQTVKLICKYLVFQNKMYPNIADLI
jgi:hypothetical protein